MWYKYEKWYKLPILNMFIFIIYISLQSHIKFLMSVKNLQPTLIDLLPLISHNFIAISILN